MHLRQRSRRVYQGTNIWEEGGAKCAQESLLGTEPPELDLYSRLTPEGMWEEKGTPECEDLNHQRAKEQTCETTTRQDRVVLTSDGGSAVKVLVHPTRECGLRDENLLRTLRSRSLG